MQQAEDHLDGGALPGPVGADHRGEAAGGHLALWIEVLATIGSRISDMTLDSGERIEAGKRYKVTGWATVGSQAPGRPVWEVVAEYLRSEKTIRVDRLNNPVLKNVQGNPGISDYPS